MKNLLQYINPAPFMIYHVKAYGTTPGDYINCWCRMMAYGLTKNPKYLF